MTKSKFHSLRATFFTQIGLLIVLAILFIIGYSDNEWKVGSFFFAMILGALGASVSLMKRIRANELPFSTDQASFGIFATLVPILYGTVLAGVAYLLFMSGLLSGDGGTGLLTTNLFPNFSNPNPDDDLLKQFVTVQPDGIKDSGKLLVWSFLAGYSERFVTGILSQLESRN
jgi:hypothetical protein